MVTNNNEARRHLLRFIETFNIRHYHGENVSATCVHIKEICCALTLHHLPEDLLHRLLDGFAKASTEDFRMMCSTQRINYNSRAYQHLWASHSLTTQLTNMRRDLEDTYRDLLSGGK